VASPPGFFLLFGWLSWQHRNERSRRRERMLERHPEIADDVRCAAAERMWEAGRRLDFRKLNAAVQEASGSGSSWLMVCLGEVEVPDVEDTPQEPMVLTPSRSVVGKLCAVICVLASVHLLFFLLTEGRSSALVRVDGGLLVLAGAGWIWTVLFRPRYVRIAPGIIQILYYRMLSAAPRIVEFPLANGTGVYLGRGRTPGRLGYMTVCRSARCARIDLTGLKQAEQTTLWRVLLSTAPTPPLSTVSLTG
jgi:hypothetical protein